MRVRLAAKAPARPRPSRLIRPVEEEIRARLGEHALPGNPSSVADALADLLREREVDDRGRRIAHRRGLSNELSNGPGASDYFLGGLVLTRRRPSVTSPASIEAILAGPGAVSEEAAAALAEAAAEKFGADVGVAATGVAGPTEQEGKPVGTVYVAAIGRREDRGRATFRATEIARTSAASA